MIFRKSALTFLTLFVYALTIMFPLSAMAASKPGVTTLAAGDMEEEYATVNAKITDEGTKAIIEYGFYYGKTNSCTTKIKVGTSINDGETFEYELDSLDPGTKYYFKAYAKNSAGITYGTVKSFITDVGEKAPSITTKTATDVTTNSAELNGELTSQGCSNVTEYGFYWGTSSNPSTKKKIGSSIDDDDNFYTTVTNLKTNTKYYFKAYAKNSSGTTYGTVKYFTTKSAEKPAVTTKTASTGEGCATLNGVVTSDGDSDITSYGFYYGTTSSPSTKIEVDDSYIAENTAFTYKLTGLTDGVTYYVKAYATNSQGTSYGNVQKFQVNAIHSSGVFTIGSSHYYNGKSDQVADVSPYIKNSRTYLPIRYVAYSIGITDSGIVWNAAAQTVTLTKGSKIVKLTINSKTMLVNGTSQTMDVAPEIYNDRTCLPIAFVVQVFGYTASWEPNTQSVTIK